MFPERAPVLTQDDLPRAQRGAVDTRRPWFPTLVAVGLALFAYGGTFKATPLLRPLPVDPVLLGLALTAVLSGRSLVSTRRDERSIAVATFALAVAFFPGVIWASWDSYSARKIILLFATILPMFWFAGRLLRSLPVREMWVRAHLPLAAIAAGSLLVFRDEAFYAEQIRFNVTGGSTIAISRIIGAGVLIMVVRALVGDRRALSLALAAGGCGAMLAVGSRGPILSLGLAFLVVAATARMVTRRRGSVLVAAFGLLAVAGWWITYRGNASTARIVTLFSEGFESDQARSVLWSAAWEHFIAHPWGIGWGGFGRISEFTAYGLPAGDIYPHNMLLESLVEGGMVAGIAVVALVAVSLKRLWRTSTDELGVTAFALAVYWLLVAQTSGDITGNRATWIFLGMGICAPLASRRAPAGASGPG